MQCNFTQFSGQFKAKCDTCGNVYSFTSGSTSNLALHIRKKHPSLAELLPLRNGKSHGKISRPPKRYKLITILTELVMCRRIRWIPLKLLQWQTTGGPHISEDIEYQAYTQTMTLKVVEDKIVKRLSSKIVELQAS